MSPICLLLPAYAECLLRLPWFACPRNTHISPQLSLPCGAYVVLFMFVIMGLAIVLGHNSPKFTLEDLPLLQSIQPCSNANSATRMVLSVLSKGLCFVGICCDVCIPGISFIILGFVKLLWPSSTYSPMVLQLVLLARFALYGCHLVLLYIIEKLVSDLVFV